MSFHERAVRAADLLRDENMLEQILSIEDAMYKLLREDLNKASREAYYVPRMINAYLGFKNDMLKSILAMLENPVPPEPGTDEMGHHLADIKKETLDSLKVIKDLVDKDVAHRAGNIVQLLEHKNKLPLREAKDSVDYVRQIRETQDKIRKLVKAAEDEIKKKKEDVKIKILSPTEIKIPSVPLGQARGSRFKFTIKADIQMGDENRYILYYELIPKDDVTFVINTGDPKTTMKRVLSAGNEIEFILFSDQQIKELKNGKAQEFEVSLEGFYYYVARMYQRMPPERQSAALEEALFEKSFIPGGEYELRLSARTQQYVSAKATASIPVHVPSSTVVEQPNELVKKITADADLLVNTIRALLGHVQAGRPQQANDVLSAINNAEAWNGLKDKYALIAKLAELLNNPDIVVPNADKDKVKEAVTKYNLALTGMSNALKDYIGRIGANPVSKDTLLSVKNIWAELENRIKPLKDASEDIADKQATTHLLDVLAQTVAALAAKAEESVAERDLAEKINKVGEAAESLRRDMATFKLVPDAANATSFAQTALVPTITLALSNVKGVREHPAIATANEDERRDLVNHLKNLLSFWKELNNQLVSKSFIDAAKLAYAHNPSYGHAIYEEMAYGYADPAKSHIGPAVKPALDAFLLSLDSVKELTKERKDIGMPKAQQEELQILKDKASAVIKAYQEVLQKPHTVLQLYERKEELHELVRGAYEKCMAYDTAHEPFAAKYTGYVNYILMTFTAAAKEFVTALCAHETLKLQREAIRIDWITLYGYINTSLSYWNSNHARKALYNIQLIIAEIDKSAGRTPVTPVQPVTPALVPSKDEVTLPSELVASIPILRTWFSLIESCQGGFDVPVDKAIKDEQAKKSIRKIP